MTIQFQYVEPGVVHIQWLQRVTVDELDVKVKEIKQIINEKGDRAYVEIVDLRACTAIPFDLRGLRRIATYDHRIIGYVVLQPSHLAKTMATMLNQLTDLPFRVAISWEDALVTARATLAERQPIR